MSLPIIAGLSLGTQINRLLDNLGLPDKLGDIIGAKVDMSVGNIAGVMRNLYDAYSGITTAQMDRFFGEGGAPLIGLPGWVPRRRPYDPHLREWQHTYYTSRRAYSIVDDLKDGRLDGRVWTKHVEGGVNYRVPWGSAADLADGRIDGQFTQRWSYRYHAAPGGFSGIPFLAHLINRHFTPLPMENITNMLNQIFGSWGTGNFNITPMPMPIEGIGVGGGIGSITSSGGSLEQKVLILMAKLSSKMDREIEDLMRQIESASANNRSGRGILGGLGGIVGGMFGPIGGLIGGAVDGIFGQGGRGDKSNLQVLQAKLQDAMQRRQQMFQTMTNLLKSLHDTSMAAIRNLKA